MISPLLLSEVVLPDYHPRAGAGCVVYGFVVHHPDGPVLVDTGVGTGHIEVDSLFDAVHHPLEQALAGAGGQPADITMVINTHLHFDHCGNNRLFPGLPFVVQRVEHEAAHQTGYTIPEWIDFPGARWILVDGETEVLPGIRVLPTPGHTVGHQSVLVSQGERIDVIAGQAVYDRDELDSEASTEPLIDRRRSRRPHRQVASKPLTQVGCSSATTRASGRLDSERRHAHTPDRDADLLVRCQPAVPAMLRKLLLWPSEPPRRDEPQMWRLPRCES